MVHGQLLKECSAGENFGQWLSIFLRIERQESALSVVFPAFFNKPFFGGTNIFVFCKKAGGHLTSDNIAFMRCAINTDTGIFWTTSCRTLANQSGGQTR